MELTDWVVSAIIFVAFIWFYNQPSNDDITYW